MKTERGQRVFPVSDKSSDVIRTLERVLKDRHVQVHLKQQVCDLWIEDNEIRGILLSGGEKVLERAGGLYGAYRSFDESEIAEEQESV